MAKKKKKKESGSLTIVAVFIAVIVIAALFLFEFEKTDSGVSISLSSRGGIAVSTIKGLFGKASDYVEEKKRQIESASDEVKSQPTKPEPSHERPPQPQAQPQPDRPTQPAAPPVDEITEQDQQQLRDFLEDR